ncbi:MAG: hypothetical protein LPJ89_04565 [Hymenobacteraceae bacterium]|nr:hypothetical protein [Hymenobacteraceae bacterium]MDX5396208.1 hypothetical protein [Hymenobacteraceae bacterium]MDX5443039.1 hypothetical protein [Hymenobacteraceae bacterium]MDX5512271.1 hypothetical protein [Hymenobacteraceae bacterium]
MKVPAASRVAKAFKAAVFPAVVAVGFLVSGCELRCGEGEEPRPFCGTGAYTSDCGTPVTVVNSVCGSGQWANMWFKTDSGEYLQPCTADPALAGMTLKEGERYVIGYDVMTRQVCDQVITQGVVCLAVTPPATPVKVSCMVPVTNQNSNN